MKIKLFERYPAILKIKTKLQTSRKNSKFSLLWCQFIWGCCFSVAPLWRRDCVHFLGGEREMLGKLGFFVFYSWGDKLSVFSTEVRWLSHHSYHTLNQGLQNKLCWFWLYGQHHSPRHFFILLLFFSFFFSFLIILFFLFLLFLICQSRLI